MQKPRLPLTAPSHKCCPRTVRERLQSAPFSPDHTENAEFPPSPFGCCASCFPAVGQYPHTAQSVLQSTAGKRKYKAPDLGYFSGQDIFPDTDQLHMTESET